MLGGKNRTFYLVLARSAECHESCKINADKRLTGKRRNAKVVDDRITADSLNAHYANLSTDNKYKVAPCKDLASAKDDE